VTNIFPGTAIVVVFDHKKSRVIKNEKMEETGSSTYLKDLIPESSVD
jgi:hypothetical protein